jgi:photosystem II PsbH protein
MKISCTVTEKKRVNLPFFQNSIGTLLRPLNSGMVKLLRLGTTVLMAVLELFCCIFSNFVRNFNGSVILEDVTMSWQTLAK